MAGGVSDDMRYTTRNAGLLAMASVCLASLLVGSCSLFSDPLPDGARRISPLAHYDRWWAMVEECSGLARSIAEVDWYSVPGREFQAPDGRPASGAYSSDPDRIILAEEAMLDGQIVRHEILHALIKRGRKELEHPATYFLDK